MRQRMRVISIKIVLENVFVVASVIVPEIAPVIVAEIVSVMALQLNVLSIRERNEAFQKCILVDSFLFTGG